VMGAMHVQAIVDSSNKVSKFICFQFIITFQSKVLPK
jgi:hypothetical protein